MSYLVLARKWRPKRFADMVGQGHVLQALTNALDQARLHHAYLFTGTRGVGKTTVARIFAKALNCETGVSSTPCGVCAACREIDEGRFVDLIEVDAASRTGVDDTRELLDNVNYAPVRGRFKIYLIDEVHMFSKSSFNALLKTLEEPPAHVKFLLATTDPQKLPVTVLSRCLQFTLRPLPVNQIQQHLATVLTEESIEFEPPALRLVAEAANGSMRDALSLLDQAIAFTGGVLRATPVAEILGLGQQDRVWAVLDALAVQDAVAMMAAAHAALDSAVEPPVFLAQLIEAIHRLAFAQWLPPGDDEQLPASPALRSIAPATLQLWYQIATLGRRDLSYAPNARLGLEMVLLRLLAFAPNAQSASAVVDAPPSRPPVSAPPASPPASPSPSLESASPARVIPPPAPVPPAAESALPNARVPDSIAADAPLPPWYELVEKIRAPGRAVADHCRMVQRGEKIILHLAAEYEAVANKVVRENLLRQLTALVGDRPIEFVIDPPEAVAKAPAKSAAPVVMASPEAPSETRPEQTPAARRAEAQAAADAARRAEMRAHPVVQVLQTEAEGTLLEDTIKPRRDVPDASTEE